MFGRGGDRVLLAAVGRFPVSFLQDYRLKAAGSASRRRPTAVGGFPLWSLACSHRKSRSCRKLVFSLPRRPDQSAHRVQESIDIFAAERRRRVAKHALAVVPMHGPAARLGCSRPGPRDT